MVLSKAECPLHPVQELSGPLGTGAAAGSWLLCPFCHSIFYGQCRWAWHGWKQPGLSLPS